MSERGPSDDLSPNSVITIDGFGLEKYIINATMKGGMGVVYQLIPVRPGMGPMALKTFQTTADPHLFDRECEVWTALSAHPNVAKMRWYGQWQDKQAILAEWYEGALSDFPVIDWPTERVVEVAAGIIQALSHAFTSAHVIHQDIKPGNILLDENYMPKLSDFGLARLVTQGGPSIRDASDLHIGLNETTSLGHICGTPLYMAPELFREGGVPSVRTDIYSLGVTLFELLTGEHPYIGEDTRMRFSRTMRMKPLLLQQKRRGPTSRPLIDLIVAACQVDPANRPGRYKSMLSRLGKTEVGAARTENGDIERIVSQAQVYREQGRPDDAAQVLEKGLERSPSNPILLNAYGVLLMKQADIDGCLAYFSRAFETLQDSGGRCAGKMYTDPLVNAAGVLLLLERHDEAHAYMRTAWEWCKQDERTFLHHWYNEFGWMFLFEGDSQRAVSYILETYRSRRPDSRSVGWLVLATWLCCSFRETAQKIGDYFLQCSELQREAAVAACIVLPFIGDERARALLASIDEFHADLIANIERRSRLGDRALRPPKSDEAMKVGLSFLDMAYTGGKNCDNS